MPDASCIPFVSVIVPVLNGERTIRDCLVSLLRTDYPADRREILVVDNGSTDQTAEIVKSFPVRYLREERRGASHARNRGIETSRGEILAFTDADCVVTTSWLRELVRGFEDARIGAVEGETVDYPATTPVEQAIARSRMYSHEWRRTNPLYPYVIMTNAAFRREVFHQIGLFDARFPSAGGEDIDFTWRFLGETNLKLRFNPKAIVFHRHRHTVRSFFSQQMRDGRAVATLRKKYPERIPWSWGIELQAWGVVARSAWTATKALVRYHFHGGTRSETKDAYLTFLRRLAARVGFLLKTVA